MTNVSYDILKNGVKVANVVGYQDAVSTVERLGRGAEFKTRYTESYSKDSDKEKEWKRNHARKVAEAIKMGKAFS